MDSPRLATSARPVALRALALGAADRHGAAIDLAPVRRLLDRILESWEPQQIWLFGSRARGDSSSSSDWDLLVVVSDESADDVLDPLVGWRIRKECGVRADVVACRVRDFSEDRTTPNTLAYEAATEGVLLYER